MADAYDEKARDIIAAEYVGELAGLCGFQNLTAAEHMNLIAQALRQAAETARAEEREECAKVAENTHVGRGEIVLPGNQIAKAIRERK